MKVFSFCLYGPYNERYYPGMVENIHLIHKHFPEWHIFIYVGADVDEHTVGILGSAPRVILRFTGELGAKNMIHRFFAIDEPDVELMMVRDADSRVHWRDRWAIRQFERSTFKAHVIRDSEAHSAPLMGGLWGIRKGVNIHAEYERFKSDPIVVGFAHDQDFLMVRIYPLIVKTLLVHYGNGAPYFPGERAVEFPFPDPNNFYCGKVESTGFVDEVGPQPRSTLSLNFLKLSR